MTDIRIESVQEVTETREGVSVNFLQIDYTVVSLDRKMRTRVKKEAKAKMKAALKAEVDAILLEESEKPVPPIVVGEVLNL